jgi:hypothetical protein
MKSKSVHHYFDGLKEMNYLYLVWNKPIPSLQTIGSKNHGRLCQSTLSFSSAPRVLALEFEYERLDNGV